MSSNHKSIPALTTIQLIEVDRAMTEDYHIELIRMMENAGRNFAELARRWLGGTVKGQSVVVLSGNGNNGGAGMTAARHLHNWGADIIVALTKSADELSGIPDHQLGLLSLGYFVYNHRYVSTQPSSGMMNSAFDNLYFNNPWWIASHNFLHSPTSLIIYAILLWRFVDKPNTRGQWMLPPE